MNKIRDLIVILIGYCICFFLMTMSWNLMFEINIWLRLFFVDVIATIFIYLCSVLFRNSSWYDAYWSVIPPFLLILVWTDFNADGDFLRSVLVFACVMFWAIRLTYNWVRSWDGFNHEDWRYVMMKGRTSSKFEFASVDFFQIHLIPTVCVYLTTVPFCFVLYYPSNGVGIFDLFATLIIISAVILQIVSDQQMYKFRKDPNNANKVMDKGLWFYSRHPNYLGEILFWSGGLIFALGSALSNIWLIGGTIVMYILIARASIPMMDKRSAEKRDGFSDYCKNTPPLLFNFSKTK